MDVGGECFRDDNGTGDIVYDPSDGRQGEVARLLALLNMGVAPRPTAAALPITALPVDKLLLLLSAIVGSCVVLDPGGSVLCLLLLLLAEEAVVVLATAFGDDDVLTCNVSMPRPPLWLAPHSLWVSSLARALAHSQIVSVCRPLPYRLSTSVVGNEWE